MYNSEPGSFALLETCKEFFMPPFTMHIPSHINKCCVQCDSWNNFVLMSFSNYHIIVDMNVNLRACDSFSVGFLSFRLALILKVILSRSHLHTLTHSSTQNKRTLQPFINRVCCCRSCRHKDRGYISVACN